jgi:hypothetical protein
MGMRGVVVACFLACLFAASACGQVEGPPPGFAACAADPDAGAAPVTPPAPDYWHDAKPILDARCASCHAAGGIGPFPILTYSDVMSRVALVQASVVAREMPPWPPNDCCQSYAHDRSLSADDYDTLVRWFEAGAPEGDPAGAPPSVPPPPPRLSRVDVTLRMAAPYTPVPNEDTSELRCFLIEGWPFAEQKYVTGVDVRPGNPRIVHHVIVQTVGLGEVPELRARDGRDGRPGFDCRDLRGEIHVNGSVGGWTPGQIPFESPDARIGVLFPARSQIMLQVHYDVRNGADAPDQTEVFLQVADAVDHRAKGMVTVNPLWLANGGLSIEAGDADAVHTFAYDPTVLLTKRRSFFIHSVNLHMHYVGSHGRVAIHRADGSWDCLLDVPRWDYHWASPYQLAQPVEFRPGDLLYVECHWDNTAGNQAPTTSGLPPPRDLEWGAAEEMCAGILLYTETWP